MNTMNTRSGIALPASSLEAMDEHATYEQLCDRLAELTPLRNLSCRLEAGEQISNEEFADALSQAGQGLIDDMEARLEAGAVPGLPYLPRCWNPGRPEFHAAMERLKELNELGEHADRQDWMAALLKMWRLAPRWWKVEMDQIFDDTVLLPPPNGYTADGQPMFSISSIASHLGRSEAELMDDVNSLQLEDNEFAILSGEDVFKVQ